MKNIREVALVLIILVAFTVILLKPNYEGTATPTKDYSEYAACMDGCSNMQQLIYGNISYDNQSMRELHDDCTQICSEMYIGRGWNESLVE